MSPRVNSSPNTAKVGSMFSMYSPLSILSDQLRLSGFYRRFRRGNETRATVLSDAYKKTYTTVKPIRYRNKHGTSPKPPRRPTSSSIKSFTPIYASEDAILIHADYVIHKQTPWRKAAADWSESGRSCHETSHRHPIRSRCPPWSDSTSTIRSLGVIWINRAP